MLEKKKLIIASSGVGLILVLAGFFIFQERQKETVSPLGSSLSSTAKKQELGNLLIHKDEAGFEFSYPENLAIKDISGADQSVYSSLEISSAQHEGKMLIKIADTPFASLDTWLKSKEASGAGASREITLAGMPGSQIQFDNPRKLVTVVINEGIIYLLENPLDEENYWNKIHNNIVSSFTFGKTQTPAAQTGGDEVIYEEEEVIE